MKLQDQVCTLEQAKILNDLGIKQGVSVFFFDTGSKNKILINTGFEKELTGFFNFQTCFSAFTVAELGVMLPQDEDENDEGPWYSLPDKGVDIIGFSVKKYLDSHYEGPCEIVYKTEAQARAAMLIYLLEADIITVKEVNERLQ